ncbi:glyoxal oxidase N-terminus-domain-containing protein [Auriculariales sp. MPI-PUGE-AT-0066]|nr:glyoxal oxidase N-terminus-domain-containing protein [Auriculariales sp. MPI-PUGE-AT-0066]
MRAVSTLLLPLWLAFTCDAKPVPSPSSTSHNDWTTRSLSLDLGLDKLVKRQSDWQFTQPGTTGVLAMQMTVISPTQLLIIDRAQHNPLQVDGHPAWSAVYSLTTNTVRAVRLTTNSFCAGGSFLSNGTLVNIGGNMAEYSDVKDTNGLQGIRIFNPASCPDTPGTTPCEFYESPQRVRLAKPRWYPSIIRVPNGGSLIIGGTYGGAFMNTQATTFLTSPSYEYWPPQNIAGFNGIPIPSPFLNASMNANLFPLGFSLPAGRVFLAANQCATIILHYAAAVSDLCRLQEGDLYDMNGNFEIKLPDLPNGVRVTYPMAGTGVLLPLSSVNNYTPTVLICGGSTGSDTVTSTALNSQDPASAQCARLELSAQGIAAGWKVEYMPEARIMPDAVLLPTGKVLLVNGGSTGYSGYGNVGSQVSQSNADHPVFRPVIYDPNAALGSRFSTAGMPTSAIPRLYHSVATLLPSGAIAIAGSNPHADKVTSGTYPTEYRLEILNPPYMTALRPTFSGLPAKANFATVLTLPATLPPGTQELKAAVMDLGFSTHAVHMDMRHVWLSASMLNATHITVTMPPNYTIYPPGPGWIVILADGVPSVAQKLLLGTGAGPQVNQAAWDKYVISIHKISPWLILLQHDSHIAQSSIVFLTLAMTD